ncbi:hypothetical protein [Lacihabitans sp. CS3-21]|uniref:hypothetical protein n=1 Tax=Lacihabitans sp. CS3-21 TaxID=2487332 RepID=UPI0020CDEC43|nr:hypothetical protein [Lacihabitans sp. CS3-21]MCP9748334.1 hypothetical protein [Lacihabitans sp. CS3-21]
MNRNGWLTFTGICREYKIAYIGAIDDNRDESKITTKYVETAIASIVAKEEIKVNSTIAKGCVITYRK